jgi:hypothetical protein
MTFLWASLEYNSLLHGGMYTTILPTHCYLFRAEKPRLHPNISEIHFCKGYLTLWLLNPTFFLWDLYFFLRFSAIRIADVLVIIVIGWIYTNCIWYCWLMPIQNQLCISNEFDITNAVHNNGIFSYMCQFYPKLFDVPNIYTMCTCSLHLFHLTVWK